MFEKILQQLRTKYKDLGLSETILRAKAKQIEKAVKAEDEIENAVAGVEEDMVVFQSLADQNRTLASEFKKFKEEKGGNPEPNPNPNPEPPNPTPTGEQEPAWLKALNEKIDKQNDLITNFQKEKAQQSTAQQLQAKFTELKIPQSFQKLIPMDKVFATPEEMEAFVTEQKANYDGIAQEFGNAALGNTPKPLFGEAAKEGEVSPDVQARIDSKKPTNNE